MGRKNYFMYQWGRSLIYTNQTELDVILIDIQMPKMDGIRTSQLLHQLPLHRNTPIIAVTAYLTQSQCAQLLDSGITDYLTKPVHEASLIQLIARYNKKMTSQTPGIFGDEKKELPSLDWRLALKQTGYKKDLACDLLKMLLKVLPNVKKHIKKILDPKGRRTSSAKEQAHILSVIHQLHGSAAYSGLPQLKKICCTIEQELHKKTPLTDLQPEWHELLDEIDNVTVAIKAHLSEL